MHLFSLYEIFISIYVFIQVRVVTIFTTIVHFRMWIKIKTPMRLDLPSIGNWRIAGFY